ncbi:hypothetical protein OIV83_004360 [Microbotryomycetes sp. JL201]|nr:hypothetical protein OIV83_004360 [Microbotryomycetes sp. JL201]
MSIGHGHDGGHNAVPVVQFSVVDESALEPPAVDNPAAVQFGFNDGSTWQQAQSSVVGHAPPIASTSTHALGLANGGTNNNAEADNGDDAAATRRYIRYLQPMESDLAKQVEYDMDEHDKTWLDSINNERKQTGTAPVSYDAFEIIIDKLEKEWFDLQRMIPKKARDMPLEDGFCAICDDGECENSNAIVFCDGCNLAVHQGKPALNAAFDIGFTDCGQQTVTACRIFLKGNGSVASALSRPTNQCHVSCALIQHGLELKMKPGSERGELKMFCAKHGGTPQVQEPSPDGNSSAALTSSARKLKSLKSKQAYKRTYKVGLPVVPQYVFERVSDYVERLKIAKKSEFMNALCRYWSLKRQQRRGAPLLKRLHLEPWTASGSTQQATEKEKAKKLQLMRLLRNDLERVRMLVESVRKREKKKLSKVNVVKQVIDNFVWAKEKPMREVLEKIRHLDIRNWFTKPVDANEVPDYYDIVQNPMTLDLMRQKIDNHSYTSAQDFVKDLDLIVSNAILYNGADHPVAKTAVKLKERSQDFLKELQQIDAVESDVNVLTTYLGMVLTEEVVEELFEYEGQALPVGQHVVNTSSEANAISTDNAAAVKKREDQIGGSREQVLPATGEADKDKDKDKDKQTTDKNKMEAKTNVKRTVEQAQPDRRPTRSMVDVAKKESQLTSAGDRKQTGKTTSEERQKRRVPSRNTERSKPTVDEEDVSDSASSSEPEFDNAPEVEDVGNRQSFKMFNSGWVLPEGASRRRSSVLPEKALPVEQGGRRNSVAPNRRRLEKAIENDDNDDESGAESDNDQCQGSSVKKLKNAERHDGSQQKASSKTQERSLRRKSVAAEVSDEAKSKGATFSSDKKRKRSADDEDDAATKLARRGDRRYSRGAQDDKAPKQVEEPVKKQRGRPPRKSETTSNESSAAGPSMLADRVEETPAPESAAQENRLPQRSLRKSRPSSANDKGKTQSALAREGGTPSGIDKYPAFKQIEMSEEGVKEWEVRFEEIEKPIVKVTKRNIDGTTVWAKLTGYPWWPAELMDEDAEDTPKTILKSKPREAKDMLPVLFFDKKRSGDSMYLLGEDDVFDNLMLSPYQAYIYGSSSKKIKLPGKPSFAAAKDLHESYYQARKAIDSRSD